MKWYQQRIELIKRQKELVELKIRHEELKKELVNLVPAAIKALMDYIQKATGTNFSEASLKTFFDESESNELGTDE